MLFHTTDQHWTKTFVDRSAPENRDLPLFKLLNIDNFAVYYKIHEQYLIHKVKPDMQLAQLESLTQGVQKQSGSLEFAQDRIA
jgi:hypothetical protein